jgi:polar amino acid transport system substrate-binding protein
MKDRMKLGRKGLCRREFIAGGLAALASPLPLSAAPLAKVRELGVLRVAVYKHNRPWSWAEPDNSTNLRGIDVDLAGALAQKLGVKLDIEEFTAGDDLAPICAMRCGGADCWGSNRRTS